MFDFSNNVIVIRYSFRGCFYPEYYVLFLGHFNVQQYRHEIFVLTNVYYYYINKMIYKDPTILNRNIQSTIILLFIQDSSTGGRV